MQNSDSQNEHYERKVLQSEGQRLTYYASVANQEQGVQREEQLFLNLSLRDILRNMSLVFVAIITDITSGAVHSPRDLLYVLCKENRMMYIGLLMIFIAFSVYVIDITS